jgi:release factor glutamine methyltransferase
MPQAETRPAATAGDLVAQATAALRDAGSPSPRLDAELLVGHAFGRDRAWLLAHPGERLAPAELNRLGGWVARRVAGEPIAYIRGFKEWFSLRIATDARALIPRPETELLAEGAIAEIAARLARDTKPVTVWEIGTGSGAIATALAARYRTALALARLRLMASDISTEALGLAQENLDAHGLAGLVTLACGDLLEPATLASTGPADVLVANLPYLTTDEATAPVGSLRHEPRAALDGGPDGLDLVRRLVADLPAHLAPAGCALLEIGADQAAAVSALVAARRGLEAPTLVHDLAGRPRILRIARSAT